MTLLQTRVEDKVARLFERVAAERNMSVYQLLGQLVRETADLTEPVGWKQHRQQLDRLNLRIVNGNTVALDRVNALER